MAVKSVCDNVKSAAARRLYALLEPRLEEMWEGYVRARLEELQGTHGADYVMWLVMAKGNDTSPSREVRLPTRYRPGRRPPRREPSLFR